MAEFELLITVVGIDFSTNLANTTAPLFHCLNGH